MRINPRGWSKAPNGVVEYLTLLLFLLSQEVPTMKFCNICGEEIDTRDGYNFCDECEQAELVTVRGKRRQAKKAREAALESLGLVKVRGLFGGTYWE